MSSRVANVNLVRAYNSNYRLVELLVALAIFCPNHSNQMSSALTKRGVVIPGRKSFSFANVQMFRNAYGMYPHSMDSAGPELVRGMTFKNRHDFKRLVIHNLNIWEREIRDAMAVLKDEDRSDVDRLFILRATRHYTQNVLLNVAAYFASALVNKLGKFDERRKASEVEQEKNKIYRTYAHLTEAKEAALAKDIRVARRELMAMLHGIRYIRRRAEYLTTTNAAEYPMMLRIR